MKSNTKKLFRGLSNNHGYLKRKEHTYARKQVADSIRSLRKTVNSEYARSFFK